MIRPGLIVAVALVLTANAVALVGVMRNRGAADARVVLTERELAVWRGEREDTALYLRLAWQQAGAWDGRRDGFGREKLRELGFDVSIDVTDIGDHEAPRAYARRIDRRALAVFEYDGPAWANWKAEQDRLHEERIESTRRVGTDLETIERSHARMLASASRLVAVDLGLDGAELRRRYPDASLYVIVPVVVAIHVDSKYGDERGEVLERWLEGRIVRTRVPYLHVPRSHRTVIERVADDDRRPRYRVAVSWGRRYEPWITSIDAIDSATEEIAR